MFWMTVAAATAAASLFAWLMIKATDDYPYTLALPTPSTEPIAPTAPPTPSIPNPPEPARGTVGKAVGLHLKAALEAINRKEFAYARSFLVQAESVTHKTRYEEFKISEIWAYLYGQERNYSGLLKIYESTLANPDFREFLTTEKSDVLHKALPQIALGVRDFPKSIELSERWLADHPDDADILAVLGQSYYSIHNYQNCNASLRMAIEIAERSLTKPQESWLTTARFCASSLGDTANAEWSLERLCRYYPKPEYWRSYVKMVSGRSKSELATFYSYRLLLDTDSGLEPEDYSNFAQQAFVDFGLPATAERAMTQAFSRNIFNANQRALPRMQRILATATERANTARERIPTLVRDAQAEPTGQRYFELGLTYFDDERYPDAISALTEALVRSRFDNLTHARMTLAIAYLKLGNRDTARSNFASVAGDPSLERIAHAWIVRTYN
jgi:tetratricopeptide (TPR) repeat protein